MRTLALVLLLATPALAQDKAAAISAPLETELDKFFSDNLAVIQKVQDGYFATHKIYFQGIVTPTTAPDEATKTRVPDLTKKPTDRPHAWADVFKAADVLPATWPAQVRLDVYDGPRGKGYTVTLVCAEGGKAQTRTWNFGPETERDTGWSTVEALVGVGK